MQKRFTILFLLHLFSLFCFSQNLIVNGSFEEENICTEYNKNCAPEGWMSSQDVAFNDYTIDPRIAFDGTHFMAVEAGHARSLMDRTYIRSQLLCKLRKGNTYTLSFYLKSKYNLLDSIGVVFTGEDFLFNEETPQTFIPSLYVVNAQAAPVQGDTAWQKIVFTYKATGDENFIAIGNFSRRRFTAKLSVAEKNVLILVDNVSMIPDNRTELLCNDWKKTKAEIYDFNIRHNYLERYVEAKGENMRKPPVTSLTTIQVIDTLVIPDVLFATSKSNLTSASFDVLNRFCEKLKQRRVDSLIAEGHTDSRGTVTFNQQLSKARAETVAGYIAKRVALKEQQIITRHWGSQKPVADNQTAEGRQQNRRVNVYVYIRE